MGVDEHNVVPKASSLDLIDLIMAIEEEFSMGISPEEMERRETVQEAKDYIEKRLQSC